MTKVAAAVSEIIEGFGASIAGFVGGLPSRFCQLETNDSEFALVANDGSLMSLVKITGFMTAVGETEMETAWTNIIRAIRASATTPGITYDFWFMSDEESVGHELDKMLAPSHATLQRLNLAGNETLKAKRNILAKYCVAEHAYMAIWTTPARLTHHNKDDLKADRARQQNYLSVYGQSPLVAIAALRESHASDVAEIVKSLQDGGILSELLDCRVALNAIRAMTESDFSNGDWRAILQGDPLRHHQNDRLENDDALFSVKDIGYPPIWEQIINEPMTRHGQYLEYKGRLYAFCYIDRHPSERYRFNRLRDRLREAKVPWRVSMKLESTKLGLMAGLKREVAGILAMANSGNELISDAFAGLAKRETEENDPILRFKLAFCTWVNGTSENDKRELRARLSKLQRSIEGWGMAQVSAIPGDPAHGFFSSIAGLSRNSIGTAGYYNINEIAHMLPLDKIGSPWAHGASIFRTLQGQIVPVEFGSTLQTTWTYGVSGNPGLGKSVLCSTILSGATQAGGLQRIPRMAITDIGPSSVGFVVGVQDSLPSHQRHLAAFYRLTMDERYSVNPFDTHLGCDSILPDDKGFLVNLLTLLVTPAEADKPFDSMSDLVSKVVDIIYEVTGRNSNTPKIYEKGRAFDVDKYLDNCREDFIRQPWWAIVDYLYEQGQHRLAKSAQRFAVPVMADAIQAARTDAIKDIYGARGGDGPRVSSTGEFLADAFTRLLTDAMRDYPILTRPTVFDVGDARIISIDIEAVAPKGTPAANKMTNIMYMTASYMMTKEWRLSSEASALNATLEHFPQLYRDATKQRILELNEDLKWDISDEFHRVSQNEGAAMVVADYTTRAREGRKWRRVIMLLSQMPKDIPDELMALTTGFFMFEAGSNKDQERMRDFFRVSDTPLKLIEQHGFGPMRDGSGSPFLAIMKTKSGMFSQLLVNTISAMEIWTYATGAIDRLVRAGVFNQIGSEEGRLALVARFPRGSSEQDYERIKNQNVASRASAGDEVQGWIIDDLIKSVVSRWEAAQEKAA